MRVLRNSAGTITGLDNVTYAVHGKRARDTNLDYAGREVRGSPFRTFPRLCAGPTRRQFQPV